MIILDAYAVLALLTGEAAAETVRGLLDGPDPARLTAVGVAEVMDHLVRRYGADENVASLDLAQLGLADAPALGPATAVRAGHLRARHYHRRERAVSLADCIAAATAQELHAAVASSDPHLLDLCHDEGIRVYVLPDTRGKIWEPDPG